MDELRLRHELERSPCSFALVDMEPIDLAGLWRNGCGENRDYDACAGNESCLVEPVFGVGALLVALGPRNSACHLAGTAVSPDPHKAGIELGRTSRRLFHY